MITIASQKLTATVNPLGAELISLKNASGREYIWEGDPAYWGKHSPVLFPIVGTLKDNIYNYNGKTYTMARHGFARDCEFIVEERQKDSVVFLLTQNNCTHSVYPFDFELRLKYTIKDQELSVNYMVSNNGTASMPFSLGAHPAFALPCPFEEYSLKFEKDEPLESTQLENGLLSSKTITLPVREGVLPLYYDLFEKDALIFKKSNSAFIDILENDAPLLRVAYNDFPHLGIWTLSGAPFICIEPWQGYADAVNANGDITRKEGIINLRRGEKYNAGWRVAIFR